MTVSTTSGPAGLDRRWDELQFRLVFGMSFLIFLVTTTVARLDYRRWRRSGGRHRDSIFAEAWKASGTVAQIAFAG